MDHEQGESRRISRDGARLDCNHAGKGSLRFAAVAIPAGRQRPAFAVRAANVQRCIAGVGKHQAAFDELLGDLLDGNR